MPARAPSICTHCNQAHSEPCAAARRAAAARKATHDARRPSRQARGYDAEWDRARADWLLAYPSCTRCGAKAALVDHIIPIRKAPHRRLDRTNFQSLCTACHSGWKQAKDKRK